MKNQRLYFLLILIMAAVLAILSIIFLPDTVVVQFSAGGAGSTLPKPAAIAIPFAVTAAGLITGFLNKDGQNITKSYILSLAGVFVFLVMLVANCIF